MAGVMRYKHLAVIGYKSLNLGMKMDFEKSQIVGEICSAECLSDSLRLFDSYSAVLKSCKFIFASKSGGMPGFSIDRDFSDGSVVRSLFRSKKVFVLDFELSQVMKSDEVTYPLDYSISLDTQALSYLEPYIDGRTTRLPKDFEEIFNFIARDDVFVDPLPYLQENMLNLSDPKKAERIFEKIKAYEILRSLDKDALHKEKTIKSIFSEQELIKKSQEHIARMYRDLGNSALMNAIIFNFKFEYWHLLAMISIQLSNKKMSATNKIMKLLEMCDAELATLSLREISVAKAYFEKGQELTFFGKIQSGKNDLFNVIHGMVWDMWHIRHMEMNLTIRPSSEARYFFPSFLTCDQRLVEIIELYPLKACAYDEKDLVPYPFFDGDWLQSIVPDSELQDEIYSRYFSKNSCNSRDKRRGLAKKMIGKSISKLEGSVSKVSGVKVNNEVFA